MAANISLRAHRAAVLASPAADFGDHILVVECSGAGCRRRRLRVGALIGPAAVVTVAALVRRLRCSKCGGLVAFAELRAPPGTPPGGLVIAGEGVRE